jgi:alpha-beta hydrolase superfamily lysophospholipase
LALLLLVGSLAMVLATEAPSARPPIEIAALQTAAGRMPRAEQPRFTDTQFIAEDGARLPLRRWLPAGRVKAVILGLHGFDDYSHAFAIPAREWAKRGIATYAYDQRGFGGAPGRGGWAGEGRLAVDAIEASRILRRIYPGRPLYLAGESMGGAVAILAATGTMKGVIPSKAGMPVADDDGIILAAPAVWGRATMALLPKIALFAAARFVPYLNLTGAGLGIVVSDNNAMLRELARDPMMLRGARVEVIYGIVDLMDDALAAASKLNKPTLLMYGAKDQVVPRPALVQFAANLPPGNGFDHRLAYYPHGYHLLLRDLDGAAVAGDVAAWIFDRRAPLPSGADRVQYARPWPPNPPAAPAPSPAAEIGAARPPAAPPLPLAPAAARG